MNKYGILQGVCESRRSHWWIEGTSFCLSGQGTPVYQCQPILHRPPMHLGKFLVCLCLAESRNQFVCESTGLRLMSSLDRLN